GVAPGQTLTLSFGGVSTGPIPYTGGAGDAAAIQAALNGLSSVRRLGGQLTVTQTGGGAFTVSFGGYMTGFQQPLLLAAVSSGSASVQEVTVGAGGTIVDPGQVLQLQSDLKGEPVQLFGDG